MPEVFFRDSAWSLHSRMLIGSGREGDVYEDPSDPAYVLKIPYTTTALWLEKLPVMLERPLRAPDVTWPEGLVYGSDQSTIIGFRMLRATNKVELVNAFSSEPTIRWLHADYAFRTRVALNIATAMQRLHDHDCLFADVSPANTLVGKDNSTLFIDPDSFQVYANGKIYRGEVGSPEFSPPELLVGRFADVDRNVYHDAFGLADLIFHLLVGPGNHPFAAKFLGKGRELPLVDRIRQGIWPYSRSRHPDYVPRTAAPLDLLHPLLQPLMIRCFEDGHANPTARPLPSEWITALQAVSMDRDFTQIIAPRREADALARHRKIVLAATATTTTTHPKRGRLLSLRPLRAYQTPLVVVAGSLLVVAGWLGYRWAKSGRIAAESLSPPPLYQALLEPSQSSSGAENARRSLSPPSLFDPLNAPNSPKGK